MALSRILWTLGFFALLVVGLTLLFQATTGPVDPHSLVTISNSNDAASVAELAYRYYGGLSRPLFPETSMGLPLFWQGVVSGAIVLMMLAISWVAPNARLLIMGLTIFTVLRHLVWRGLCTLTFSWEASSIIGFIIFGAELLAFLSMVLGYFQIVALSDRKSTSIAGIPENQLPSVDVYVCTYNEPVSVLYRTLVGCKALDYPHKQVYLLDDGNRPAMEELAQSLGVNYIARVQNTHAKAGNMNNALGKTQGDLILVFDADHVPCRAYLNEVVGFFQDHRVGFVQTPQHFFTADPFQRNLVVEKTINNEQDLFFHVIQPGNDYWGAAFFAGSGAIFRRQALNEINGFAIETITEDVHTGLRLHAKGWKSLYYNRDLAAGLAQDSFADFVSQRVRWAKGMTQILYFDHPLFAWGLSLPQRLCYFAGIWYFFHGFTRIVFLIAPLAFLLFGFKTIDSGFVEILIYYVPSFLCMILGYSLLSKGIRQNFWSEVYETAVCFYLFLTTLFTLLSPKKAKFKVTPKGTLSENMRFNWHIIVPQAIITVLLIVGLSMAIIRAVYTPEYAGGIYTNLFWTLYNMVLLGGAIYVAQERPQFRLAPRVYKDIACEIRLLDGSIAVGKTTNISENGLAVVFDEPIPISGTMSLKVMDWSINEINTFSVQAVRSTVDNRNRHHVGFRVVNRTDEQHQNLVHYMFGTPDLWTNYHMQTKPISSFADLLSVPLRLVGAKEIPTRRRAIRFQATFPCLLQVNARTYQAYSNEISETGMSLFVDEKLAPGETVALRIQWPSNQTSDFAAQVIRVERTLQHYKLGLNFVNLNKEQRLMLIKQMYRPSEGLVRVAPSIQRFLPCRLYSQGGLRMDGYSQELSELGILIAAQNKPPFEPGEKLTLEFQWEDGSRVTYPVLVKGIQPASGKAPPFILVYFDGLGLKELDALSRKIHEPLPEAMETV